ncbi:MAG: (d)CMP kinase [Chloroflexi bacterium]|nr:(d)CMP kinase [Chloroflexota bacterium]
MTRPVNDARPQGDPGRGFAGPIAIDGPAASGKTTVGSRVAARLGWQFIDTGLMYRAVAYLAVAARVSLDDVQALGRLASDGDITVDGARVFVGPGRSEVSALLPVPEVALAASRVAEATTVRSALVLRQRQLVDTARQRVVMVGRDIGTVVLPNAPVKVYLDAAPEERARRRLRDEASGASTTLESVLTDLRARDTRDRERQDSPLRPADDARIIQTGALSVDEVVEAVLSLAASAGSRTESL